MQIFKECLWILFNLVLIVMQKQINFIVFYTSILLCYLIFKIFDVNM